MINFVFSSEINEMDTGLTIELWNRGMLWDNLLGLHWLPLFRINNSNLQNNDTNDVKVSLDSEICLQDGKIIDKDQIRLRNIQTAEGMLNELKTIMEFI
jgi:protein unc-13